MAYLRRYGGPYIAEWTGQYFRRYGGPYDYEVVGFVTHEELMALVVLLYL